MKETKMLGAILWIFEWWQLPLIAILIVLIVFWRRYRSKNM